jgi:ketosteroid isomerase-like protein
VAALYTADAVRMEDNMPAVTSRASILEGLKELTAAWDCDISLQPEETVVAGNWAFDRGQFVMHMMPKSPGPEMVMDQGKYLVILQKQADGGWQIAREIGNSNVPLPPAPAPPPQ